jgi:hypothetical protein
MTDQAETDYQRAVTFVEGTVRALGIEPAKCRVNVPGSADAFSLRRGSASMLVTLQHGRSADDAGTIRIVAPIVTLPNDPTKELAMLRKLLHANAKDFTGAAFALLDGQVVVVTERSVEDLDASEVEQMIRSLGRVADRYDDVLASEFGVQRVADRTT